MTRAEEQLKYLFQGIQTAVVLDPYWGDSGKGKIVDFISFLFDIVSRFSGGANAGHTVVLSDGVYIGHLIPMGIKRGKICILPQGEYFDPIQFFREIKEFKRKSSQKLPPILVSGNAPLKLPWDSIIEAWIEHVRGKRATGTTGRGIGSIAANQKLRIGPRVNYIFYPQKLKKELRTFYKAWSPVFDEMVRGSLVKRKDIPTVNDVFKEFILLARKLKPYIADARVYLHDAWTNGKRILFEGAQGLGLDEFGTYHWSTAGICTVPGAARGTGLPMEAIGPVILVVKAYPTRVGKGPFPTELWNRQLAEDAPRNHPRLYKEGTKERREFLKEMLDKINRGEAADWEIGWYIQVKANEAGATTGRGRSPGWSDLNLILYSIQINNPKILALTRLDALSGLKKMKIGTNYILNGKEIPLGVLPSPAWLLNDVQVRYLEVDGWDEDIYGITDWNKLPCKTKEFIWLWERLAGRPVGLISTGAKRDHIIIRKPQYLRSILRKRC